MAAGDEDVLVYATDEVVAFLDRRPVFPGHTLVVPRAHRRTLADLPVSSAGPMLVAVQTIMDALADVVGAEGTFVAANNRISQSVDHLHVHVVPRRRKDGLRGFFWPRHPYEDEDARRDMQRRLRAAVAARVAD